MSIIPTKFHIMWLVICILHDSSWLILLSNMRPAHILVWRPLCNYDKSFAIIFVYTVWHKSVDIFFLSTIFMIVSNSDTFELCAGAYLCCRILKDKLISPGGISRIWSLLRFLFFIVVLVKKDDVFGLL